MKLYEAMGIALLAVHKAVEGAQGVSVTTGNGRVSVSVKTTEEASGRKTVDGDLWISHDIFDLDLVKGYHISHGSFQRSAQGAEDSAFVLNALASGARALEEKGIKFI